MQAERQPVAGQGKDPDQRRNRPLTADLLHKAVQVVGVEDDLRHREPGAGVQLLLEPAELDVHVVGSGVDRDAVEERRRRVDWTPVEVLAAVEVRHQLSESDRVDLVDAARPGIVADLRRIAGDREHVPDALCV